MMDKTGTPGEGTRPASWQSSLALDHYDDGAVLAAIRGHWSAIENGTHDRRDVSLGEDTNRTAGRKAAAALASLRNLANGIYELEFRQAVQQGLDELDRGEGIPIEKVKAVIAEWAGK